MTTEFIKAEDSGTAEGAINALAKFEGQLESIHAIYLTDARNRLEGVVPLARLLLAGRDAGLQGLSLDPVISVPYYADQKMVMNLFRKYNLLSLPVVDDGGRLIGVITADDVFELVVRHQ